MVDKITCIIIEDEAPAAEILESYIAKVDFMVLRKSFGNITQALPLLNAEEIDLIFLDINLPGISGLSFAKTLNNSAGVIFTTAFPDYAVEGFELDAIDYLLKPISFERFIKAINKFLKAKAIEKRIENNVIEKEERAFIVIKSDRRMVKIFLDDILYFEAQKNYLNIVTPIETYRTYQSISDMEEKIPAQLFLRVHRSFIVSLNKIIGYSGSSIEISEKSKIPIGRQYKPSIFDIIKSLHRSKTL